MPRPTGFRRDRTTGFTLLELLTALAVVAVLLSILIPVVGSIREKATQTACASRLRAIGSAVNLFVADNGGFYPTNGIGTDSEGNLAPGFRARRWPLQVSAYMDVPTFEQGGELTSADIYGQPSFRCPAVTGFSGAVGIYGYNDAFGDEFDPLRSAEIEEPANTILMACLDGPNGGLFLRSSGPHPNARDYGYEGPVNNFGAAPVHPGGTSNFLFADGHVENRSITEADDWPWNDPAAFDP